MSINDPQQPTQTITFPPASATVGSGLLWVSGSSAPILSSIPNDPGVWGAKEAQIEPTRSEMRFGDRPEDSMRFTAPPPNIIRRLLWRALGVTWKDLRPENQMGELRRLK